MAWGGQRLHVPERWWQAPDVEVLGGGEVVQHMCPPVTTHPQERKEAERGARMHCPVLWGINNLMICATDGVRSPYSSSCIREPLT